MAAVTLGISSCQKEFDTNSYAPALNINGYTSSKQVAPSNLIAHWGFDDTLIDSVSNTAGVNKGTTFSAGVKGRALQGATDSYVLSAPSAKVTSLKSFTITEWINTPAPTNGIIGIFSLSNKSQFWGNLEMFIENGSSNTDGKIKVVITNNGSGDKGFLIDKLQNLFGSWNAIAVSYDQTTSLLKIYVNGSRVASTKIDGITGPLNFVNSGNIVFGSVQFQTTPSQTTGATKQDWASFLVGQVDEVRIYDKALSDVEIGSLSKLEGRGK